MTKNLNIAVHNIDLTTAGSETISGEYTAAFFKRAVNAAGSRALDALLQVRFGQNATASFPWEYADKIVSGTGWDEITFSWEAQSGVTATIVLASSNELLLEGEPPASLAVGDLASTITAAAVTAGVSEVSAAAANSSRKLLTIQNNGSVDVYIGPTGVTTSSGLKIAAGGSYSTENSTAAYFVISGTASQNCRILEEG
jgi:hypothetical protein